MFHITLYILYSPRINFSFLNLSFNYTCKNYLNRELEDNTENKIYGIPTFVCYKEKNTCCFLRWFPIVYHLYICRVSQLPNILFSHFLLKKTREVLIYSFYVFSEPWLRTADHERRNTDWPKATSKIRTGLPT